MTTTVTITSVNVALPTEMPVLHRGRPVRSGIAKRPVSTDSLWLDWTNLAGDGQADLTVHGGRDKAVYAYSADLWPLWETDIGRPFGPADFGENITVSGVTEADVCIGDVWVWGDAELEVCQPRTPCYKLTLHAGTAEVGRVMRRAGRSGWYLRVTRPGTVPAAGTIDVVPHPDRVSVLDTLGAAGSGDGVAIGRVLAVAALADEWRIPLSGELAGVAADQPT